MEDDLRRNNGMARESKMGEEVVFSLEETKIGHTAASQSI
jgi:hypothetical protein